MRTVVRPQVAAHGLGAEIAVAARFAVASELYLVGILHHAAFSVHCHELGDGGVDDVGVLAHRPDLLQFDIDTAVETGAHHARAFVVAIHRTGGVIIEHVVNSGKQIGVFRDRFGDIAVDQSVTADGTG